MSLQCLPTAALHYFFLRSLDSHGKVFAILTRKIFRGFMLCIYTTKHSAKGFNLKGLKFVPFRVEPLSEGTQNYFDRVVLPESVHILSLTFWGLLLLTKINSTHLFLASHKRGNVKQCRPRSDAAERGV